MFEREILKRLFESNRENEGAGILPDEEDTIIRGEHHPISTSDKPNMDVSESLEGEEDEVLDEKTYTVGDTQYWKRGGKCYKWTEAGGRQECSDEDYFKAISGGKNEPVKPTEPKDDAAKSDAEGKTPNNSKGEYVGPNKKVIQGKTFKVDTSSGKPVISASMYDLQSRLSKLEKFAKENGIEVEYIESKKKKSEEPKTSSDTDTYTIPRNYKDPRRKELEGTLRKEFQNMESGDIVNIDGDDFVKSTSPGKFIRRTTVNGKEYKDVVNSTYLVQHAMVMGTTDRKVSIKKKSQPTPIEQRRNAFYDDSESDYVHYDGVRDFDHTTWDVGGEEATIQRNPSGRGYYLQTEDYDEEFDTKGDLVSFLRDKKAQYQGQDSEKDY